jgi:broad specificity phosphatase PhoE
MRVFIFARHAESAANVAHVLSSDPSHSVPLTARGRAQARELGARLANLKIDLAVTSRFLRTRQTVDVALIGRDVPVHVESDLDEVRAGSFDGRPIETYWAWKDDHAPSERFPQGESLSDAVRRFANALRHLLRREEAVTLIVAHELALRYLVTAAAEPASPPIDVSIPNAALYLFDERALQRAVERLDALGPEGSFDLPEAEAA